VIWRPPAIYDECGGTPMSAFLWQWLMAHGAGALRQAARVRIPN
jgi:hypothetical protein